MQLSNKAQYFQLWKKESDFFEQHGIYEQLSKLTPAGNVLEFGCGTGKGTFWLSEKNPVLSLDNNPHLIDEARRFLSQSGRNVTIHQCDFFELSQVDKRIISNFSPNVLTGWFIGSDGEDIFARTGEQSVLQEKSKLYREKIEDILASPDVCLSSVEYIHLVSRGGRLADASDSELFS
ncbi:class I SAM-dependent methyltransferase [Erwinia psidii]|uniref:class I SAM-dependent methyltransferase n=1 Tax=Erwinia psidii TaxID=69224 RepID=UPI00226B9393|nr:class I SAM-dependent methyltransferase [Erwinia psidii]